jgi:homoserine O-succinyltransferase
MFNHLEYDTETLRDEFLRDRLAGKQPRIPANYFPDNDPTRPAANVWRPWAHLLFGNWLAEIVRGSEDLVAPPAGPGSLMRLYR